MGDLALGPLSRDDVELVRQWRARFPYGLRTPVSLTYEQQQHFYDEVVCDRRSPHRYWAVRDAKADRGPTGDADGELLAQVGLVNIEWENSLVECSLITNPDRTRQGIGSMALHLLLEEAFDRLGLKTVWGECYGCNPEALEFWKLMVSRYRGTATTWPRRKFWNGVLWPSYLFTFSVDEWKGQA